MIEIPRVALWCGEPIDETTAPAKLIEIISALAATLDREREQHAAELDFLLGARLKR